MHTASKRTKSHHPLRQYLNGYHRSHKRSPRFARKIGTIYSSSVKTIKKKPYQAAGVVLTLSLLSGALLWLRFLK